MHTWNGVFDFVLSTLQKEGWLGDLEMCIILRRFGFGIAIWANFSLDSSYKLYTEN
jgi:hypothetical protein